MNIERCPLTWPVGRPRTPPSKQSRARFNSTLGTAVKQVMKELRLLGATDIIVSTNLPTKRDDLPYTSGPEPKDPGVSVWFKRFSLKTGSRYFVIACDTYDRVRDNMRAVAVTVEAMRTIHRHGAETILEQAFSGFAALPPAKKWFEILGVPEDAPPDVIKNVYNKLAAIHHPDKPTGSTERMVEINKAYQEGLANEISEALHTVSNGG